jgi:RNA polymerase sigma-70 factor (ECF subfamily)
VRALRTRPWLLQIALNVFRNRVRGKRLATRPLDDSGDDAPELQVEGDARERPDVAAESDERQRELAAHLAGLPQHFRAAVVLRHVEGLGYAEMAAILGQPVGTVKAHVHRGTRQLRAALERERSEVGIR